MAAVEIRGEVAASGGEWSPLRGKRQAATNSERPAKETGKQMRSTSIESARPARRRRGGGLHGNKRAACVMAVKHDVTVSSAGCNSAGPIISRAKEWTNSAAEFIAAHLAARLSSLRAQRKIASVMLTVLFK